jgi:nucleolar GTP-binding protein
VDEDERELVTKIKARRKVAVMKSRLGKHSNRPVVPRKFRPAVVGRTGDQFRKGMSKSGYTDVAEVEPQERGRKRTRGDEDGDAMMEGGEKPAARSRSRSRHPAKRPKPRDQQGTTTELAAKARKMMKTRQRKMNIMARAGEADRNIREKMPKHLYSGKMSAGTSSSR